MNRFTSALHRDNLTGLRVFLRADLNVPITGGFIEDDFKLQGIAKTLNLLLKKKATIILATHLGRPKNTEEQLSTRHLIPWFTHHGYSIEYCNTIQEAHQKSKRSSGTILLLENLRFNPGEKAGDPLFADQLRSLADYYVNDAFGTLHRTDCSVLALPQLFEPHQRTFGLLIEKELNQSQKLLYPQHPFCVVVGGGKIEDKLSLIQALVPKLDMLLLCPGIDREFMSKNFLKATAQKERVEILAPDDYLVGISLHEGPFTVKKAKELVAADFAVCIGPETQKKYAAIITRSKTVFYNGLMGTLDNAQTLTGVHAVFTAMQHADFSLVGGGDSTAAARKLGFEGTLSLSTGGGALLAYVSGQKMPALEILINNT